MEDINPRYRPKYVVIASTNITNLTSLKCGRIRTVHVYNNPFLPCSEVQAFRQRCSNAAVTSTCFRPNDPSVETTTSTTTTSSPKIARMLKKCHFTLWLNSLSCVGYSIKHLPRETLATHVDILRTSIRTLKNLTCGHVQTMQVQDNTLLPCWEVRAWQRRCDNATVVSSCLHPKEEIPSCPKVSCVVGTPLPDKSCDTFLGTSVLLCTLVLMVTGLAIAVQRHLVARTAAKSMMLQKRIIKDALDGDNGSVEPMHVPLRSI